jgi:hypothetical protein
MPSLYHGYFCGGVYVSLGQVSTVMFTAEKKIYLKKIF